MKSGSDKIKGFSCRMRDAQSFGKRKKKKKTTATENKTNQWANIVILSAI
jgi:hypothetical protein